MNRYTHEKSTVFDWSIDMSSYVIACIHLYIFGQPRIYEFMYSHITISQKKPRIYEQCIHIMTCSHSTKQFSLKSSFN